MKKMSLTTKILVALILGAIVGVVLFPMSDVPFVKNVIIDFFFVLVGKIFLNSIKMMVVPLVFVSLVVGAAMIGDVRKLGRIGSKTIGFYLLTTAVAITIAITLANVTNPGLVGGISMEGAEFAAKESPALVAVLYDMVPTNPISSLANGKMLQIIVFALFVGTALTIQGEKAKSVFTFFEQLNDVNLKIVELVMKMAPVGVFCLIAKTFATLGWGMFAPLAVYMLTVIGALFIHALFTYQGLLAAITKLSPVQFFRNFSPAMAVAFSTASSSSTLPITIETTVKRCGVEEDIASFCLPLGATINMDGTAIMQGVATVFIAQLFGVDLTLNQYMMVIVTATLASVGTAGVPGVGLIMLSMVLQQVGLPVEGIAIIMGVDRILDMTRTAVNITGDAVCTVLIAQGEGDLNKDIFNAKKDAAFEAAQEKNAA